MNAKSWLIAGAVLGALGVALGAFGAHALADKIPAWYPDAAQQQRRLEDWETAVRYQMYHALALLAVGWLAARSPGLAANLAGGAFVLGVLVFSGCLYLLVLTDVRILGAVVPIGGVSLIVGWVALAIAAIRP